MINKSIKHVHVWEAGTTRRLVFLFEKASSHIGQPCGRWADRVSVQDLFRRNINAQCRNVRVNRWVRAGGSSCDILQLFNHTCPASLKTKQKIVQHRLNHITRAAGRDPPGENAPVTQTEALQQCATHRHGAGGAAESQRKLRRITQDHWKDRFHDSR